MPEGPEVWILSQILNKIGLKTVSKGKHIRYNNLDYSFGLQGYIHLDENNNLIHKAGGLYSGKVIDADEAKPLGIDWMTSSERDIISFVDSIKRERKMIASILTDQSRIAGIGVTWGSEIMYRANLNPDSKACHLDLTDLAKELIELRNYLKVSYLAYSETVHPRDFVNRWYRNLYSYREDYLQVYKKGEKITIGGRIYWK